MVSDQPAFALKDVGFLRDERWILRDINFSVPQGRLAAILGPNGSGKSTIARILSGYLWPSVGSVEVLGQRFGATDLNALRQSIALVQSNGPYEVDASLSALEVVLTGIEGTLVLYRQVSGEERELAAEMLNQVGLAAVGGQPYRTLSNGERLRCLVARAMIKRPSLLILDEPTAGLDLLAREQVLATIDHLMKDAHGQRMTVLLITHHVEELIPVTYSVLLLSHGQVVASGSPREVLEEAILSRVYGCPVKVKNESGRWSLYIHPDGWRQLLTHHYD